MGDARYGALAREVREVFVDASALPASGGVADEGAVDRNFAGTASPFDGPTGGRRRARPRRKNPRGRRPRYARPARRDCVGLAREHKELLVPQGFQTSSWIEERRQQFRRDHVSDDEALARWGDRLELAYWFYTVGNRPASKYLKLEFWLHRDLASGIGSYILTACGYTKSGDVPKRDVKGRAEERRAVRAFKQTERIEMRSNTVEKLPPIADLYVNVEETANWLGISRQSLYERIARNELPKPQRFGKRVVFERDMLTDHIRRYLRGEIART